MHWKLLNPLQYNCYNVFLMSLENYYKNDEGPDIPCRPYYATNDEWDHHTVQDIRKQQSSPEAIGSTVLMCGSGGLPYIYNVLGNETTDLIQFDMAPSVIELTKRKLDCLNRSSSWEDYLETILGETIDIGLPPEGLVMEFKNMEGAGLCDDALLPKAQKRSQQMRLAGLVGDVLELGDQFTLELAQSLEGTGQLSLALATNLADWVDGSNEAIGQVLDKLPRTANFRVLDNPQNTSMSMKSELTSLADYRLGFMGRRYNLTGPIPPGRSMFRREPTA
jgi:hypothetical protein